MGTRVAGAVLLGLGILFIAVSMVMNFQAGLRLGETPSEGQVFAWVAVGVAGANAALPVAVAWGVHRGRWGIVAAASLLLAVFLFYSLGSALSYAAGNRGAVAGQRDTVTADFKAAQTVEADLRRDFEKVAKARDGSVIEQEMARQRQDRLWSATKECTEATAPASRQFCKGFFDLQSEAAASAKASGLYPQLKEAAANVARLRAHGAGRDADPQASVLNRLFGISSEDVQSGWSLLFAGLVELGCALVPVIGLSMLDVRHGTPVGGKLPAESSPRRSRVRRRSRQRGKRLKITQGQLIELPPLRETIFDTEGQLKITDQSDK